MYTLFDTQFAGAQDSGIGSGRAHFGDKKIEERGQSCFIYGCELLSCSFCGFGCGREFPYLTLNVVSEHGVVRAFVLLSLLLRSICTALQMVETFSLYPLRKTTELVAPDSRVL